MDTKTEEQNKEAEIDSNRSVPKDMADRILSQAIMQLQTSRLFKRQRMEQIRENEDLYLGVVEKQFRNPFNECFPFMAGYVDQLRSKINDDSNLLFVHKAEADLKRTKKLNAFWEQQANSIAPNAMWSKKHRYAKYNAIFSGVAIYSYWAEKTPKYKSNLEVVSHYDFHCEPRGGGILENHLFCGVDNIFKNKEDIEEDSYYDKDQVTLLVTNAAEHQTKDSADYDNIRNNRFVPLGQDPVSNNYVGQDVIKLTQFFTTYKGKRYYILFSERARTWLRCCPIEEMFPDGLYPYPTWHTNEDPDVFWSKAPADDARPVAKTINKFINQELYNREKRNHGQRGYDVDMFPNVQALADSRPDGLVPIDTKNGSRAISSGIYEFKVGDMNGTLDLVTWLDAYSGRKTGNNESAEGATGNDKKVGVFNGEIAQSERLIGVKNKSYQDCLTFLGLLFKQGVQHNLSTKEAIQIMGAEGIEWDEIGPEDLKFEQDLTIQPIGGTSEQQLIQIANQRKTVALTTTTTVNPQWKDRQTLLMADYTEDELKDAFSTDTFAVKELLSEAAEAEKMIVEGKTPKLNRGATAAFMQHILDFATDTEDLTAEMHTKLIDYAMAHTEIAVQNSIRSAKDIINKKKIEMFGQVQPMPNAQTTQPQPQMTAQPL